MAKDGRHAAVQHHADRQFGIVRVEQLREAGFSPAQIHRLRCLGVLHPRHKGIYAYATERPPWKGVLLAAQWSCGEDAYLTGRTALALAGLGRAFLGRIEVAVPRRSVRRRPGPIHLIRPTTVPESLGRDGPLRFAPVPDALRDLARGGVGPDPLARLITEAIHARRLDHARMRALVETTGRIPGHRSFREAYASYLPAPDGRSRLEHGFDAALRTRPHLPRPEPNFPLRAGGVIWELDRYWPEQRLVVELHGGGYHHAAEDLEKDTFKAAQLARMDIQVLAITDTRWELEPDACLDDLEALLALRGWRVA